MRAVDAMLKSMILICSDGSEAPGRFLVNFAVRNSEENPGNTGNVCGTSREKQTTCSTSIFPPNQ